MHNLDRNLLLELCIGALSKVNLAHPARTQGAQHAVRPDSVSHHFWSMHPLQAGLQSQRLLRASTACVYVSSASWPPKESDSHVKWKQSQESASAAAPKPRRASGRSWESTP